MKDAFRRLRKRMERISIGQRTMLTFFVMIFLSMAVLASFASHRATTALSDEVMASSRQMVQSAAQSIDERFQEAIRVGNLTLQQTMVINAMEKIAYGLDYPLKDQLEDVRILEDFLYRLQFSHDLQRVRLLFRGTAIYTNQQINYFHLDEEEAKRLEEKRLQSKYVIIEEGLYPYIFDNEKRVFSIYSTLTAPRDFFSIIGAVAVDIPSEEIHRMLAQMITSQHDAVLLISDEGDAVLSAGEESLTLAQVQRHSTGDWQTTQEGSVLYYNVPISHTGWMLSYRINRDQLFSSVRLLQRDLLFALLTVLAVTYLLTLLSSRLSVRRIKRLATAMSRVRHGDLDFRVREGGGNEVGILERSFNYLLDRLQEMLEHKMQDRMALQNTQIRLLQTQIQPHFLYNTLDMINWRLLLHDDATGSRLVQALAQFYRIGLSRGQEKIPLRDELQHVLLYIEIQNFRLDGRLRLEIKASPDCFAQPVLGNILQPLVENSVLHGIMESEDSAGQVRISAERRAQTLCITVADDGIGIDPAQMQALVDHQQANHFGVWNIQQRIRLVYGEEFGIRYRAKAPHGTEAEILLPWSEGEREDEGDEGDAGALPQTPPGK